MIYSVCGYIDVKRIDYYVYIFFDIQICDGSEFEAISPGTWQNLTPTFGVYLQM